MGFKTGRLPRHHNPRLPHFSALTAGRNLPPPPASADYLSSLPDDLGMMLNDILGDCTCAAIYHAIQVWNWNCLGRIPVNPDTNVLQIYQSFCGYNPADPYSDQGGVEQIVLKNWMNLGVPDEASTNQLSAYIEIDPRNTDDVKRAINSCAVCYIGFTVPSNIMPINGDPPKTWVYDPTVNQDIGGHAVILSGYSESEISVVSWGSKYTMTWEFFSRYVDEAYALINSDWINTSGKTPLGMTLAELEAQMLALRN